MPWYSKPLAVWLSTVLGGLAVLSIAGAIHERLWGALVFWSVVAVGLLVWLPLHRRLRRRQAEHAALSARADASQH